MLLYLLTAHLTPVCTARGRRRVSRAVSGLTSACLREARVRGCCRPRACSASGIGMPSPMGAAPSNAIDEPHAPRPVGSRQRCRSASSDSGRQSQSSATCTEYKGRDRALYPEDGTPGFTKPKVGLTITLIHGAGVHCPSPRIVTYSRPFAPKLPRPLKNSRAGKQLGPTACAGGYRASSHD
jgi:hypothetical protein